VSFVLATIQPVYEDTQAARTGNNKESHTSSERLFQISG
jgi:hypothetical protein